MNTDPKSVVVRYIEAARDGMSAVIRDSFAPDATWEYPGGLPLSGTYQGTTSTPSSASRSLLSGASASPTLIPLTASRLIRAW